MNEPNLTAITPAVHLEFIQNEAGLADSASVEQIEQYHRSLFLHHHAHELEQCGQRARIHQDRLAHLDERLRRTHLKLAESEKLVPVTIDGQADTQPAAPWNLWDRAMFGAAGAGILSLLIFGVLNISFNLLESGLITFAEHPIRAYFWAALLPVGALAVKIGWDFLGKGRMRDVYLWSCLVTGIAGVLVWVGAYAAVYPALSKTVDEHLQSLSVFDTGSAAPSLTSAGVKRLDAVIVAAQAVAEIFLSAALGIYMTILYLRHRPVRLAGNPLFLQLDDERKLLEESVARERLALAEAEGARKKLENQLAALVAYARSIFQKETAARRDQTRQKQLLLEQVSEQLRTQLAAVDNGGHSSRNNSARPALDRGANHENA